MRVLVTGVNGQLGHDAVNELSARGHEVYASDITERYSGASDGSAVTEARYIQMDITDKASAEHAFSIAHPDAVLHAAAWTAVDAAEDNKEKAEEINAGGTENIAEACLRYGAEMMYISTDYVFSGEGERPWQADDRCFSPLNWYGKTKLDGEEAVRRILSRYYIVRIAWVFGANGNNFVKTMLRLSETHEELRVVRDQIGTPTYTKDLSVLLSDMIGSSRYGTYHATNEGGYISWAEFAEEIMRQAGRRTRIVPVTTEEYGMSRAKRPYNSRLDKAKLEEEGFSRLPEWKDALGRYLEEIGCR